MNSRASLALAGALAFSAAGSPLCAQSGAIAGVVVSQEEGMSLPYGVISAPSLGRERFTTVAGTFVIADLPAGDVKLLVRRLGYVPKELTVTVRAGITDTIRVELARVAVKLAAMQVRAYPECKRPGPPHPGTDSALATVFAQLRMNAEQYRLLATSYPFSYAVVSVLGHVEITGVRQEDFRDTMRIAGLPKWKYRPGRIVTPLKGPRRRELFVNLPTLVDFADSTFIANHCFHNGGIVAIDSVTAYRIDFLAASKIKSPDFSGAIYLDTATYQIRRSVLRVWPLPKIRGMTEMEVTTDFQEVLPSIPVIWTLRSRQSFNTLLPTVTYPTVFDEQRLIGFLFLGAKPGEDRKP